jgi:hypothetical protein
MSLQPGPDPIEMARRALGEGEWLVPIEMVLACTSSALKDVVLKRFARGEYPRPSATVIARGNHFFGMVDFQGERHPAIFMPLDVWTLGDRP